MRDSEIKTLFAKADEQVHVDEIRKQKTYYAMIEEMEKLRTPMMSTKNILFHQFWYMDKFCCLWCPYLFRNYFYYSIAIYRIESKWDDYCMYGWSRYS